MPADKNTWISRDECPALHATCYIVEIKDLIQLVRVRALNNGSYTPRRLESCKDGRRRVCCRGRGDNAGIG